jgi:hypothetical protein
MWLYAQQENLIEKMSGAVRYGSLPSSEQVGIFEKAWPIGVSASGVVR